MKNKLIIVAGCSGSGKSTISKKIKASFNKKDAQIICMDRFYKANKSLMPSINSTGNPNFDHPDAFDWPLLKKTLSSLLYGKKTLAPVYDYTTHSRKKEWTLIKPTKIIIFEGVLSLFSNSINKMAELKVYVDTSIQQCFARRLERDQKTRGRTAKSVQLQWNESVMPMYHQYVKPRRWKADFLIPWDRPNKNSVKYLIAAIQQQLVHKD